jgi:prepilin-type N-terminal cleavage/methylation domain-containing protein
MESHPDRFRPHRPRGFTLIEIVVVLFIVGVVITMAAGITKALTASQKLSITTTRMAAVDIAIVQYVMQQKRLPCPANGTLPSTDNNAGLETARTGNAGCTTNQSGGVVPWRSLGLSESDATDGWNHRLTYRVLPALAADGGMDMSWCDPAGTVAFGVATASCVNPCTSTPGPSTCTSPYNFTFGKGLEVRNVGGAKIMDPSPAPPPPPTQPPPTGAAYVVISAGSSGGGAYLSSGLISTSAAVDGTEEQKNYASVAVGGYYVDDTEISGATHFDDVVSHPTVLTVINKAGLGPRAH